MRGQHATKGKVVPVHAMKAYRGSGGIAPFILNLSTRWEVNCQHHTPAPSPLEKESLVPFEEEAGWAPEPAWEFWRREKSSCPSQDLKPTV
jgi:hypothetical protein